MNRKTHTEMRMILDRSILNKAENNIYASDMILNICLCWCECIFVYMYNSTDASNIFQWQYFVKKERKKKQTHTSTYASILMGTITVTTDYPCPSTEFKLQP